MPINPGNHAIVKTTEEPVAVLQDMGRDATGWILYTVRRPVQSQPNGVQHELTQFYEWELETIEDRVARIDREEKAHIEKLKAAAGQGVGLQGELPFESVN